MDYELPWRDRQPPPIGGQALYLDSWVRASNDIGLQSQPRTIELTLLPNGNKGCRVEADCNYDCAVPFFNDLLIDIARSKPNETAVSIAKYLRDNELSLPADLRAFLAESSSAPAPPTPAIVHARFVAETVVGRVRVPKRSKEYRNWYETWQKLRGQSLSQPYAKLAEWLERTHPQFKCSPDLVADIIRAGQAHLLDHELSYSEH